MNKHDRAKMEKRIVRKLEIMLKRDVFGITSVRLDELVRVIAREVDRAVKAERRAQRLANEEANKWREEAHARSLREALAFYDSLVRKRKG